MADSPIKTLRLLISGSPAFSPEEKGELLQKLPRLSAAEVDFLVLKFRELEAEAKVLMRSLDPEIIVRLHQKIEGIKKSAILEAESISAKNDRDILQQLEAEIEEPASKTVPTAGNQIA